jgi:small subunit ribosomal protein S21
MPRVSPKHPNEQFEAMLRRFKKAVERSGIMQDLRNHEFFETPSQARKKANAAAVKRWHKFQAEERQAVQELRRGARPQ